MKTLLPILVALSLFAFGCTGKGNQTSASSGKEQPDSSSTVTKTPNSSAYDIKGVWWPTDTSAPTATFAIDDSTVFYPDQEGPSSFRYDLKSDTLVIHFETFSTVSIIDHLRNDTLIFHDNEDPAPDTLVRKST